MKSIIFLLSIALSGGLYACQSSQKTVKQSSTQTTAKQPIADSIVRDTVTNSQGVKLAMAYDNAKHTATFVLNGTEIKLKQDTTASGIKYSNSEYEYTEHQGKMTLKKGNEILFHNQ
ncbi:MliC family protein [Spirosoma aerolatum]|uniref:MliC family protein n=1 Tax=Spirosoma aerolatum TaxID=1211326 RepID=UPI0009ACEC17|nr:MliC family protein [Spirosoma aerolatum]